MIKLFSVAAIFLIILSVAALNTAPFKFLRKQQNQEVLFSLHQLAEAKSIVVTLGHQLNQHGQMQAELIKRLEVTLQVAKRFPELDIVVSGGAAREGVTEAALMKSWLAQKGVAPERIIMEAESTTTVENALFTTNVLANQNPENVILISSAYHLPRAAMLFRYALDQKGMDHISIQALGTSHSQNPQAPSLCRIYWDFVRIVFVTSTGSVTGGKF